jgi:hypothetical protein
MVVIGPIKRNPRKRVFLCLFNFVYVGTITLICGRAQDVPAFIAKMGHINSCGRIICMHSQHATGRKIHQAFARF